MPDSLDDLLETPVERRERRRRRRVWPWVVGILGVLLIILVAVGFAGAAFAREAFSVRDDLEAARDGMAEVPALVRAGDAEAFQAAAADILVHTSSADRTVQGPLWDAATWVPWVGQNVAAVRGATEATHILVRDALPASIDVLGVAQIDRIRLEGGGFDLEPFREVIAVLPTINAAFAEAEEHVAGIDRGALVPIVSDAVGQVLDVIDQGAPLLRTIEQVLPPALELAGDSGPRTYLVLFQNNAEIRATGGNAAASALMRADDGRITLVGQLSSSSFIDAGLGGRVFTDLPQETLDLYYGEFAGYSQNYTMTPDFPTSARMFSDLLAATGTKVDGVIAIDPVVLADILRVAGPLGIDGGELNADNAVKVLLSDTYERFGHDGPAADRYFAAVAAGVFTKLIAGSWDPVTMIETLQKSADDQRVYAWFPREEEEQMAVDLGIDGALATDNADGTEVGIFLNDFGVGKLEYYLSTTIEVSCNADAGTMTTAITMNSAVPGADLSQYTLSLRNGTYGMPRTTMLMDVLYVAPPGSTITGSEPADGDVPQLSRSGVEQGRDGASITIGVPMGESRTVSFTSTIPDDADGPVTVRHSPTATRTPVDVSDTCASAVGR